MSSSSDDEDALALLQLINVQRHRRYWVHPVWRMSQEHRYFKMMEKLCEYPDRFPTVYKMSLECFHIVLSKVRHGLQKKHTNWREPICPEERLLITLRYYADGCSFKSLSTYVQRGSTTVQKIVQETSRVLWEYLQPEYMPIPTTQKWLEVAQRFYTLWNLPNCVGSIDGKHIRIKAPKNSGSAYINYKGYFSIVLMAVVDADGLFLTIDVGEYGRNSDGRAFQVSYFGQAMEQGNLNLPHPTPLPGETNMVPYYFIADEAFPLKKNLMKPYGRNQLTNERRAFNNRLSRARKSVECAFGMIRTKFSVLSTSVCCDPENVDSIIKAMSVLHNVIRKYDGKLVVPRFNNSLIGTNINVQQTREDPKIIREYLTTYMTTRSPVPFQNRHN
ncbi:unnamed protein product [Acanthoscelides obtectus]|uniref:DDE Tnp4 domain-containing protein n=1 Tax=Acanthoscelides obtectus TaxID=200917 RepID=A0A9P0KDU8_ACAOB|nr:unnamed protein product [Acanthoscelides obtectus]CAK1625606.1 Protein ALP1-like [Acanthoscelides obtectus]